MAAFFGIQEVPGLVRNLTIVNDPAERGVGLIKKFIGSFHNETSLQNNLLAVPKHRQTVGKTSKKSELKIIGKIVHC